MILLIEFTLFKSIKTGFSFIFPDRKGGEGGGTPPPPPPPPNPLYPEIVKARPATGFPISRFEKSIECFRFAYSVGRDYLKYVVLCYNLGRWEFEHSVWHCMSFELERKGWTDGEINELSPFTFKGKIKQRIRRLARKRTRSTGLSKWLCPATTPSYKGYDKISKPPKNDEI